MMRHLCFSFFFFNDTATTEIYTLSLHDALPISGRSTRASWTPASLRDRTSPSTRGSCSPRCPRGRSRHPHGLDVHELPRSEEHTSELQSPCNLVCRLLLEKKKHNDRQSIVQHVD